MGKKRIKHEIISTTVTEVERGIALCVENTLRFVRNAAILLENKGSDGLAYVLWSLAVEEYGKGILLRQQITKCGSTNGMCRVEFSKDHYEKFTTGLADMKSLKNTKFERLLRVKAMLKGALRSKIHCGPAQPYPSVPPQPDSSPTVSTKWHLSIQRSICDFTSCMSHGSSRPCDLFGLAKQFVDLS